MERIELTPIGRIRSPYASTTDMPIQPCGAKGVEGRIELDEELAGGLKDLEGFSHCILLYHFHASSGFDLEVVPFLDREPHGVFATRAPRRPNPIGLSVFRLAGIEGSTIYVRDVDVLDKTPLLDIKPYVSAFDAPGEPVRCGWIDHQDGDAAQTRSDGRFK